MKGKGNLSFHPVKGPKGFYDCEKEMQSSKISMWSGYHLSIEGIRKGYLSSQKWFIKGVGPRDRASPWKTLLSAPPPPISSPGWHPETLHDKRVQRQEKKCKRQFTLRTSWKLVSSIKEKKLLEMNRRHDSWIEETATWIGSVHLTSGVQEEILSQWFSTSMAEEITCRQVCLMSKV